MLVGCKINHEKILAIIVLSTVRHYTLQKGNHTIGILSLNQNV